MNRKTISQHIMRMFLAALCSLSLIAAPIAAQQQSDKAVSQSQVERKNRAPVSKDVLQVKLPKAQEFTLDNGLTVLILEDHRLPLASATLNISGAGPLYEPQGTPGLAIATAAMLREGTKTRNTLQIAQEVDKLGATLNAFSGWGSAASQVSASGLSDNFDQWFALAVDILMNPTFPAEELAKYKERTKAGLRQQRSSPGFLLNERFSRAVYGSHPASVRTATAQSLDAISTELMAKWHSERYAPQNAILSIAGDVDAKSLVPKLKQWLAGWKRNDTKEVLPPNPAPVAPKKVYVVDRPGSVQTDVAMGNIAIDRRDPDYFAVEVMNAIVGGGASARLFLNLRENKGYTYGVYSNYTALKYPGPWQAGGNMRTDVTEGAMNEFLVELNRIRDEKVPAGELEDNKRSIVARFALSLESPQQLLNYSSIRKIYGFPEDYWDKYPERIMAVTADDVQRVARKYINPGSLQIVAVGDASKIKSVMEKYGPVEVYDTEGKPAMAKAAGSN